jgi:hypothetical protein
MTDKTTRDTQDFLTSSDRIDGVVEHGGRSYPITVEVPTVGELQDIEDAAATGDEEAALDAMRTAIDEYLVEPDLTAADIAVSRLEPLFAGMMAAWTDSDDIDAALEEVETGNRQPTSRPSRNRH